MTPNSRAEARRARYATDQAHRESVLESCHRSYAKNRAIRLQKQKEYRERNRDAVVAARRDYYLRNADKIREKTQQWRIDNPELAAAKTREWRAANADRVKGYGRADYEANRAKRIAAAVQWNKDHPGESKRFRSAYQSSPAGRAAQEKCSHKRRAALLGGGGTDDITSMELAKKCRHICGICGERVLRAQRSIDHIVPLSKGGQHVWENVQLAHRVCNSRKGAKLLS